MAKPDANDFSFLSEEERRHILGVLEREEEAQKELDVQVKETAKRLQSIQKAARSENGCKCCGTEFGIIFNRGALCPKCSSKVCKACRKRDNNTWECSKCSVNRELQLETGTWFYQQGPNGGDISPSKVTAGAGPLPAVCKTLKKALAEQTSVATITSTATQAEEAQGSVAAEQAEEPQLDPDRHSLSEVDPTPLHKVASSDLDVTGSVAVSVQYKGGKVIVGVQEIKGLANPRANSLPNPYYRLYMLPDDEHATKKISPSMRGTCWPLFNSLFEFEVPFDDVFDKILWLSVWDHVGHGSDSFLGETRLPLSRLDLRCSDLLHYTLHDRQVDSEPPVAEPVVKPMGVKKSSSHESLFSVSTGLSAQSKGSRGSFTGVTGFLKMSICHRHDELQVSVERAINLANPHRFGNPDPYVKAYLLPDANKETKRKTKAARQTVDPQYNSTLTWPVSLEDAQCRILHIAVFDCSKLGRNKFLGEVRLRLDSVDLCDATVLEYPLAEQNSQATTDHILGGDLARVSVGTPSMSGAPTPESQRLRPKLQGHSKPSPRLARRDSVGSYESVQSTITTAAGGMSSMRTVVVTGFVTFGLSYHASKLHINVVRCIDLAPPRGPGTVADPYIKLYLLPDKNKATKRKTKAKKRTLDPRFDETLSIKMNESELRDRTLWLSVWDNHTLSRNTFLGEVRLKMASVDFAEESPREIPLFDLKSPEVKFSDMAPPAADPETHIIQEDLLKQEAMAASASGIAVPASRSLEFIKTSSSGTEGLSGTDPATSGAPVVSVSRASVASEGSRVEHTSPIGGGGGQSVQPASAIPSKVKDLDTTSLYSVGSVATMAPGASAGKSVVVTGNITLAVYYGNGCLHVKVKGCKGLASPHSNGLVDPYVKTYLVPDKAKSSKKKTKAAKKTTSPVYSEDLQYKLSRAELSGRTLWVSVWDNARLGHNAFLGEVRLLLDNIHVHQDPETFDLQEKDSLPSNMVFDDDMESPHSVRRSGSDPPLDPIRERASKESLKNITSASSQVENSDPGAAGVAESESRTSVKSETKQAEHVRGDKEDIVKQEAMAVSSSDVAVPASKSSVEPASAMHSKVKDLDTTSLYSVGSVATMAPGASAGKTVVVTGNMTLAVYYNNGCLHVKVKGCKGLASPHSNGLVDPYVKTYLVPDKAKSSKKKTKAAKKTTSPVYSEDLQYKLSRAELSGRTLWVSVWDNARLGHNAFLGEVRLLLDNIQSHQDTETFDLQEKDSLPSNMVVDDDLESPRSVRKVDHDEPMEPIRERVSKESVKNSIPASPDLEKPETGAAGVATSESPPSVQCEIEEPENVDDDTSSTPASAIGKMSAGAESAMNEPLQKSALNARTSNLKRSNSVTSIGSTASAFVNSASVVEVTGSITLSILFVKKKLDVHVVRCEGLSAPPKRSSADSYVKAYLLPDPKKQSKKKTKQVSKSLNPTFNETLTFKTPDLTSRVLWVSVWDNARLSQNTFLGEIRLDLGSMDFSEKWTKTFNLMEKDCEPVLLRDVGHAETAAAAHKAQEEEEKRRLEEERQQQEAKQREEEWKRLEVERQKEIEEQAERERLEKEAEEKEKQRQEVEEKQQREEEEEEQRRLLQEKMAMADAEEKERLQLQAEKERIQREADEKERLQKEAEEKERLQKEAEEQEHQRQLEEKQRQEEEQRKLEEKQRQEEEEQRKLDEEQKAKAAEEERRKTSGVQSVESASAICSKVKDLDTTSLYSVGSVATMAPGASAGKSVVVTGNITLAVYYGNGCLHVKVKGCKGLASPHSNGLVDPYVKTYLVPDKAKSSKKKTKAAKKTTSPVYSEDLQYKLSRAELSGRTLWVSVWDNARLGHNAFLGEVRLLLDNIQSHQDTETFDLQEKDSLPSNMVVDDDLESAVRKVDNDVPMEPIRERVSKESVKNSIPASPDLEKSETGAAGVATSENPPSVQCEIQQPENVDDDKSPTPASAIGKTSAGAESAMNESSQKSALNSRTTSLKRSNSVTSIGSTASAFVNSASVVEVTGSITLSILYVKKKLDVHIVRCEGLSAPHKRSTADSYVKAYLLPDPKKQSKKKTKQVSKSLSPTFNETLSFKMPEKDLTSRVLWVSVWDNARLSQNTFLGELRLDLSSMDFSEKWTKTFNLVEKDCEPVLLRAVGHAETATAARKVQEEEEKRRLEEERQQQEAKQQEEEWKRLEAERQKEIEKQAERELLQKEAEEKEKQRQEEEERQQREEEEKRQKAAAEEEQRLKEQAEKERLQKEAEEKEKQRQEEEERQQREEEERRQKAAAEEEQRLREQAEKERLQKEAEEKEKQRQEEEERQQREEEERRQKAAAEEEQRLREQAEKERLQKEAEEKEKQRQEEEERQQREEEERRQKAAAEEEQRLKEQAEKERLQKEAEEKEKQRQEEERQRREEEEEEQRRLLEEKMQKADAEERERLKLQAERERLEREANEKERQQKEAEEKERLQKEAEEQERQRQLEEKQRQEEEQRKLEEKQRQEEEQRKLEEKQRQEEEQRKLDEEQKTKAAKEERLKKEAEAAEEERKRQEAEEHQKKLEEERIEKEAEEKRIQEEQLKRQEEYAARRKQEEEAEAEKQKQEEEAEAEKRRQEEEAEAEKRRQEELKKKELEEMSALASPAFAAVIESAATSQSFDRDSLSSKQSIGAQDSLSRKDSDGLPRKPGLLARKHSISSLTSQQSAVSTYSIMGSKKVMVTGSMTVAFSFKAGKLNLNIVGCKDLASPNSNGQITSYVKAYLLPDSSKESKKKTKSFPKSRSPTFNETISYKLEQKALDGITVHLSVWDKSRVGHNTFLGEIRVPLYSVDLTDPTPAEYVLCEPAAAEEEGSSVGELVLSLRVVVPESSGKKKSKSPKITVEALIESADNLPVKSKSGFIDPFVKGYLLPDTKNKQKTQTLSRNNTPVWKHTLVFEGALSAESELENRSMELTVWDFDKRGSNDFLGGLLLGLDEKCSPEESQHWQDLMAAPAGQWVERRHFLQMNQRR
ncbi:titin homolog isoform X2 [Sycon ciliatum]|uniref:titin homolog isoform X2 n=1 Tax=Sycon ciliatum TaxID=27933 RepID=UPI0031F6D83E